MVARMTYEEYIKSDKWRQKRELVLSRDHNKCQTCLSDECLEVHHKTYDRLFNESLEDLITLCHDCHHAITNVIRNRRYSKREIKLDDFQPVSTLFNLTVSNNETNIEIQDYRSLPYRSPQWTDGRSFKPFCEGTEEDFIQKIQNRRRF